MNGSRVCVAVVEDNPDLLDDLRFNLELAGFAVATLGDGAALDQHLARETVDVLVLDLGLPGEDGLSIARRLQHSHPELPIVMLTARIATIDRISGYEEGAASYLCKPVHMGELAAVVASVARRSRRPVAAQTVWELDQAALLLRGPDDRVIALTGMEAKVLATLATAPLRQASRHQLIQALSPDVRHFDERRLEACISRLRRKLAPHGAVSAKAPLKAIRGGGYLLAWPVRSLPQA